MNINFKTFLLLTAPSILGLPRYAKRLVALVVDVCLCILSTWMAFYLRIGEFLYVNKDIFETAFLSILFALPIFGLNGLYHAIFRYSGWPAIHAVGRAMIFYGIIFFTVVMVFGLNGTPRTIGIIQPMLLFFAVASSRLVARFWLGENVSDKKNKIHSKKAIIYGAGITGRQLATNLSNGIDTNVIGFFDDDIRLHGQILNGIPIFDPSDLKDLKINHGVSLVLLALPAISRKKRNEIIDFVSNHNIAVRTVPSLNDLALGKVKISDIYDLDIDDLLGREPVIPNHLLLTKKVERKTILITGAGGSIGSELSRQIVNLKSKIIILIDHNEFSLYIIHSELENFIKKNANNDVKLIPLLGSITDKNFLKHVFNTWNINTVYHAAAYKHVPLVEFNVINGLLNNIFGTLSLAKISIEQKVNDFILISSDKAVRPTNLMGASKRLSEMLLQSLFAFNKSKDFITVFSMVRFGNVMESSGSVIPKFRQQIRDGGPITLTHPKINRYFMTTKEAAQLVIQAGAMAKGGEVFVLDMGDSILVYDLALRMLKLSGLTLRDKITNPDGDIDIQITGLRPGEKLFEELLIGNNPKLTDHPKIKKAEESYIEWNTLDDELKKLKQYLDQNDIKKSVLTIKKLVNEYNPSSEIADLIYKEKNNI